MLLVHILYWFGTLGEHSELVYAICDNILLCVGLMSE